VFPFAYDVDSMLYSDAKRWGPLFSVRFPLFSLDMDPLCIRTLPYFPEEFPQGKQLVGLLAKSTGSITLLKHPAGSSRIGIPQSRVFLRTRFTGFVVLCEPVPSLISLSDLW
jgi:hypothetical protein